MASLNNSEKTALIDIIDKADCPESLKSALLLRILTNNTRDSVNIILENTPYSEILELVQNRVRIVKVAIEKDNSDLVPLEELVL